MAIVVVPVPDGLAHISPSTKQKIGEKNSKILKSPVVDYWSPSFTENLLTNMFVDEVYSPDFMPFCPRRQTCSHGWKEVSAPIPRSL